MNPIVLLSSACPLILCSIGALFTEYAGVLALFMEGLISFSAFLTYTFTIFTGSAILGTIISSLLITLTVSLLSILIQKLKAHVFISGIALNLIFASLVSVLSSMIFGTQGVLTAPAFNFNISSVRAITIITTVILITLTALFLRKTKPGIYIRVTGSDSDVLLAKGVNPQLYKIISWSLAAFFASISGAFLAFRINSFVPNISSGRGWMALAAVFIGKKKTWRIVLAVFIFCLADIFSIAIQNYINIPSSLLLAFPYLIVVILISVEKK